MKIFIFAFLTFLILLSLSNQVLGVGIGSPTDKKILFEPNLQKTFSVSLVGANNIRAGVEGQLKEYVTLIDGDPDGGPRNIQVVFNFPEYVASGTYTVYITALEVRPHSGTVSGVGKIRTPFQVRVLNPEKEIRTNLYVDNGNVDEIVYANIAINSFTVQNIEGIQGIIDIYNEMGKFVARVSTNTISLASDQSTTITAPINTSGFTMGMYKANATVHWDLEPFATNDATFRLGTLGLSLENYTKHFAEDTINPLKLLVSSNWNGVIEGVHARIVFGDQVIDTPTTVLNPFTKGELTGYWDTRGFEPGEVMGMVTLYYADQTAQVPIHVFIDKPKEADAQIPGIFTSSTIVIVLAIVLIILVLGNLIYFVWYKRRK